jgi:hypothetical protein
MTETFVPLSPATLPRISSAAPVGTSSVVADNAAFQAVQASSADTSHSPDTCAKPTVTLQRNGEVVTGIRVQCGCGKVIELNCFY